MSSMFFRTLSLILAAPALALAQSYGLEALSDEHGKHIAPPGLQRFMRAAVRKDFEACIESGPADQASRDHYFGCVDVPLAAKGPRTYLVFPSRYCASFFGAHAIVHWIVSEAAPGRFRILYQGGSDGIEILKSSSKGYSDLESSYGQTFIVLRFNGRRYRRVAYGDYPRD